MHWNEVKECAVKFISDNNQDFQVAAKEIWSYPELGMEEFEACRIHKALLRRYGFSIEENAAGMPTAYIATYGAGHPVVGISAEMDALPMLSQKATSERDPVIEGAPGHACGHNLLGVGSVLAAVAVAETLKKFGLPGAIKCFGAPAEENCIGKAVMGKAGLYEGVDVFLDWHPFPYSHTDYAARPSYFNMRYHFKGKTSHGSTPWMGRSALEAAMLMGHALDMMKAHIPPAKIAIPDDAPGGGHRLGYSIINAGPESPGVIPDRATIWLSAAFSTSDLAKDVLNRVDKCAEGAAISTGTTAEQEFIAFIHEMIPNETVSNALQANFQHLGDVEFTDEEKSFVYSMQEEDGSKKYFSELGIRKPAFTLKGVIDSTEYSWVAPYGYVAVNLGPGLSWHNWMITACAGGSHGEKTLNKAAQVLSSTALDFIQNTELLKAAQEEHRNKMEGRTYESLIPDGVSVPLNINRDLMTKFRDQFNRLRDSKF
ncbi:MAG: amidohydrolase [Clostridiales Family XIII bacterium]|jgi:aminobenzoyl-glutamate utilization protein B|nr:amidohydrolase [Clostridiales Family XIII bacterium]